MTIPDFTDPGRINAIVDEIIDQEAKKKAYHVVRKLTEDECWIACALQRYQDVEKNPRTGELHRTSANEIAGMLNKCADETLLTVAQPDHVCGKMDNAKDVFVRLARVLLKKRGVQVGYRLARN